MKAADVMSRKVRLVSPDDTLQHAASAMAEIDAGALPVADGDGLVGMLTDRDIVVRGVAQGIDPQAKVSEAMSDEVLYCFEDEDVEQVCRNLADQQIRRLPVMDRNKRLVGILSLGDLATEGTGYGTDDALADISRAGGSHAT